MSHTEPPKSKKQVDRAGKSISENAYNEEDIAVVDQWRASHSKVLDTFKAALKLQIKNKSTNVDFVQRLKRRNTVINKLQRKHPDGTPLIHNITSMHDFAGCRLSFDSVDDLRKFRNEFRKKFELNTKETAVGHLVHNSIDKYDYITHPKPSGYRGIHDVFIHRPKPHRTGSSANIPWHGLKVEVQYRTHNQNAWATAVEMADMIDNMSTKFNLVKDERGEFFSLASAYIERTQENSRTQYSEMSDGQLKKALEKAGTDTGIPRKLTLLSVTDFGNVLKTHTVLDLRWADEEKLQPTLKHAHFSNSTLAIKYASELESDPQSINAVYVSAENPQHLRRVYKNYFTDAGAFLQLIK